MNKKRILVLGQSFQDFHMLTKDDKIIDGRAKYAYDAYEDSGGIDTVVRVVKGLDMCDAQPLATSCGKATIINKETPFVYLTHLDAQDTLCVLYGHIGEVSHIHISYINLLHDSIRDNLIEMLSRFNITISADLASSPSSFDFSPWKDIVNWWIARDIDLMPVNRGDHEFVIAHNQHQSTVHNYGKLLYCGNATTLPESDIANVTGAGDVFAGTFLSHYLSHGGLHHAIDCAHAEATDAVKYRANAGRFTNVPIWGAKHEV